jgi:hypothetical protein
MKLAKYALPIAVALIALVPMPALAQQGEESFKGEVVAVQQQTQNQGADQVITLRTRNGEQKQFRLGSGSCEGCVRVGDQVRARVSQGAEGRPGQVQSMKVKRQGEMFGYSNQSGQLVRTQQRSRDGSGDGQKAQWQQGNRGNGSGKGDCGNSAQRGGGRGNGGGPGNGGGGR